MTSNETSLPDLCFLNPRELASRWHVSEKTLERWRAEGYGPSYVKLGRSVRYRLDDVWAHERRRSRVSTSSGSLTEQQLEKGLATEAKQ